MPSWVITSGGILAIVAICSGSYRLLYWGLSKLGNLDSQTITIPAAMTYVILSTTCAVLILLWFYGVEDKKYDHTTWQSDRNEVMSRRTYRNESVEIDGKTFDHCRFINVTFIYHGLANVTFIEAKLEGTSIAKTDNISAVGYAKLLALLKGHPQLDQYKLGTLDQSGNLTVIEEGTREPSTPKESKPQ